MQPKPQPQLIEKNEKIVTQARFFSTKKKRKTGKAIKIPTIDEQQAVKYRLQKIEPSLCSVCFKKNDDTNNDEIEWVECSNCCSWVHQACIGLDTIDIDNYKINAIIVMKQSTIRFNDHDNNNAFCYIFIIFSTLTLNRHTLIQLNTCNI